MLVKILMSILPAFSICCASFSSDLDTLALKMASALKLSPQRALQVTVIDIDKNYMLPLDPVLSKLKEKLAPYSKEVIFNAFNGEENSTIRSIVLSGGGEYAPISMEEKKIDSLLLTGYYDLYSGDSSIVNFHIKIINLNARLIFQSDEFIISKKDCPAAFQREIFDQIGNDEKFAEMEYRGKIIKQFDDLFHNTRNNNLLAYPAEYRFVNKNPYAINWQVEWIKDILTRAYGITFNDQSADSIVIEQSKSVIFFRGGKQYSRAKLVDGESTLPDSFPEEYNSYHYINTSEPAVKEEVKVENRKCATQDENVIRDKIHETFNTYYPELFNNFNYSKLDSIYIDQGHPSILVGTKVVDDPAKGKEQIKYIWQNKKDWLNSLKKAVDERHRRFCVQTSVMGLFNDNLDHNRWWAVVKQKWQTKDLSGHVVYQDDGFLLVNFDFDADDKLKDFKIYYRLWFYDYQYDDVELGVKRYEKLVNDIRRYFVDSKGISGIDSTLKKGMMEFLVNKVKTVNTGKQH
jgi:hypothetical protein